MTQAPLGELLERLGAPWSDGGAAAVDQALETCKGLHAQARSNDALPLAEAGLAQCERAGDRVRELKCLIACGLLAADTGDMVGGIGYHLRALRHAAGNEDRLNMSRCWNNLGAALGMSGNFRLAARCYQRCIALVEPMEGPNYSRYTGYGNLSDMCYQLGRVAEAVEHGERCLREMTPEFLQLDPHGSLIFRRNLVRAHLAAGNLGSAASHLSEAMKIAERWPTPRTRIAADVIRASYDLATGRSDLALTRLDETLSRARQVPATLRDTLGIVVKAEEAGGNAARALLRLEELSDHVYNLALERARDNLEMAGLREAASERFDSASELDRVRLESQLMPREAPESWKTLQRLAVGAAMRFDDTAWHGKRVGALTKALALANGAAPLPALEMGLAAELHDIGMLSVPEGILAKGDDLNESERALVQRHIDAGAEILRDDTHPMVFMAREIARYHHAHWDGSGYPARVAGSSIPLGARICSIADAYDSMVCGIAHQPKRDMGEALTEIKNQAGRQFDPALVSCFDALIRSESEGLGVDLEEGPGMADFQQLVSALREDRGFV